MTNYFTAGPLGKKFVRFKANKVDYIPQGAVIKSLLILKLGFQTVWDHSVLT